MSWWECVVWALAGVLTLEMLDNYEALQRKGEFLWSSEDGPRVVPYLAALFFRSWVGCAVCLALYGFEQLDRGWVAFMVGVTGPVILQRSIILARNSLGAGGG